jgi:hypothetical protein
VGAAPDFLWGLLALMNFMRFSLMKDALASLIGAACKKSGSPHRFRPRYALANLDWHPSFSFGVCCDTDSTGRAFLVRVQSGRRFFW